MVYGRYNQLVFMGFINQLDGLKYQADKSGDVTLWNNHPIEISIEIAIYTGWWLTYPSEKI